MKVYTMIAAAAWLVGCADSGSGTATSTDTTTADTAADANGDSDSSAADTLPADVTGSDSTASDSAAPDVDPSKDFGFAIRKPASAKLSCAGMPPPVPAELDTAQMDWLCSLPAKALGEPAYLYAQFNPDKCESSGMSANPSFKLAGAWLSQGGKVTALGAANYDWGGNHHNDAIEFDAGGKHWRAYHSSFGFGWRQCQPMDCLQQTQGVGGAVVEDGCTKERTLPAVCRPIKADGSYDALVDSFKPCLGDPNFP